jgi:hypothetical protein
MKQIVLRRIHGGRGGIGELDDFASLPAWSFHCRHQDKLEMGRLLVGVGAIAGLVLGVFAWRNQTIALLRIHRTPPGEAPEEIRCAWMKVILPLRRSERL